MFRKTSSFLPFILGGLLAIFQPKVDVLSVVSSPILRALIVIAWLVVAYLFTRLLSDGNNGKKRPAHEKPRSTSRGQMLFVRSLLIVGLLIIGSFEMREDHYFVMGYVVRSSFLYRWVVPVLALELFGFVLTRALLVKAVGWKPMSPELIALSRREFRTVAAVLSILDLLLLSFPHGLARWIYLVALYIVSACTFGNFLSIHRRIRRHIDEHPEFSIESHLGQTIQRRIGAAPNSWFTKCVNFVIHMMSRFLRVLLPIATAMTVVLAAAAFSNPNPSARLSAVAVRMPPIAQPPAQYTLGPNGYAAICGNLSSEQPGFELNPQLSRLAKRLWLGAKVGLGAGFTGCWSRPEVIHEPHGLVIVYDLGALNHQAVSLSIITSAGEMEIYIMDGGRLSLATRLLKRRNLITGTPRITLFNGDVQLIYTGFGTAASLREVKHPTGEPDVSTKATTLNESATVVWAQAMMESSEMLWPTKLINRPGCNDATLLAPTYGRGVAILCSVGKSSEVGKNNATRITFIGSYAHLGSRIFHSNGQKFSIRQITQLAKS